MKKHFVRTRKAQYGGVAVVLTVLVIAVTVLANAVFSTLASRYEWYIEMTDEGNYDVSSTGYALLDEILNIDSDKKVEIIFCDRQQNVVADSMLSYVYKTARAMAERHPDRLTLHCYDTLTNPSPVKDYATAVNMVTGETQPIPIYDTSVIVVSEGYHRVYGLEDFFAFKDGDTSTVWAYNGEKTLLSGILHAVDDSKPVVCLTNNHGEVFYDYELMYLLDDAGYAVSYIDLYKDEIPENCELIISYNPNTDLIDDTLSERSEIDILDAFLSEEGHGFLVFVDNGTPALPNFERYLKEWGFAFRYYTDVSTGSEYRYMVQHTEQSLTSDGYTIYGESIGQGKSAQWFANLDRKVVFRNSTAMMAATGFVNNGDGSYTKENRTMYSLYESGDGSVSWAHGAQVASGSAILMGLSQQSLANGVSRVGVASSVRMFAQDYLQSAVYGNTDLSMRLFQTLGKEVVLEGVTIRPFLSRDISTVTISQMLRWTLTLTLTPAVAVAAVATVVLVRRRRA